MKENRDICVSISYICISVRDNCISDTDICILVTDISYYIKYRYLFLLFETSVFEMQIFSLNRFKPKRDAIPLVSQ